MLERLRCGIGRRLGRTRGHPALARIDEAFRGFDQRLPLSECVFTVLDTELTGLDPGQDEIVSIGAVRIRGLAIVPGESFHAVVRPSRLPKACTLIHRITPSEVEQAPRLAEVLPEFVEFLGPTLVVGHHVGLDMAFLNRACARLLGGTLSNPCLDTLRLARVFAEERWENYYDQFDLRVSYTLADLTAEHGLPAFPAHDAFFDALQAAYLFLFLVRKLHSAGGGPPASLTDLYAAGRSWRWYF